MPTSVNLVVDALPTAPAPNGAYTFRQDSQLLLDQPAGTGCGPVSASVTGPEGTANVGSLPTTEGTIDLGSETTLAGSAIDLQVGASGTAQITGEALLQARKLTPAGPIMAGSTVEIDLSPATDSIGVVGIGWLQNGAIADPSYPWPTLISTGTNRFSIQIPDTVPEGWTVVIATMSSAGNVQCTCEGAPCLPNDCGASYTTTVTIGLDAPVIPR